MFKIVLVLLILFGLVTATPFLYREYTIYDSKDPSFDDSIFNQLIHPLTPRARVGDLRQELDLNPSVKIIDIRSKDKYDLKHVEGAILIPQVEIHEAIEKKLPIKSEKLYVYGDNEYSSALVTRFLRLLGYESFLLEGGLEAWEKAGMPIEKANSLYF